jgi:tetratricopeptide (TPR) repeat protein
MIRYIMIWFLCIGACVAWSDTVYLDDGTEVEGKVVRTEKEVRVTTADGKTQTIAASKVLYVASDKAKADDSPIATDSSTGADAPISAPPSGEGRIRSISPVGIAEGGRRKEKITLPQTMIFSLQRRMEGVSDAAKAKWSSQLHKYRALAHDRCRKFNGKWYDPKEFTLRRERYIATLNEAKAAFKSVKKESKRKKLTQNEESLNRRWTAAGYKKLREAAGVWTDPLVRMFLLGIVSMDRKDYSQAEKLFKQCVLQNPEVAVFHQGLGETLRRHGKYVEALQSFLTLESLMPGSKDALQLLSAALRAVPGDMKQTSAFLRATARLKEAGYVAPKKKRSRRSSQSSRATTIVWLFPGGRVSQREHTLPVPPMDRVVIRQGIAVPISKHKLLIDRQVVEDAAAIRIQFKPGEYITLDAKDFKVSKDKNSNRLFSLLEVDDIEFTPVDIAPDLPSSNEAVIAHAVDFLAEMGRRPRSGRLRLKVDEDVVTPSLGLLAGEASAPVFDRTGALLGFLTGRTDWESDDENKTFLPIQPWEGAIEKIRNKKKRRPRSSKGESIEPEKVTGTTFLVRALHQEQLEHEE